MLGLLPEFFPLCRILFHMQKVYLSRLESFYLWQVHLQVVSWQCEGYPPSYTLLRAWTCIPVRIRGPNAYDNGSLVSVQDSFCRCSPLPGWRFFLPDLSFPFEETKYRDDRVKEHEYCGRRPVRDQTNDHVSKIDDDPEYPVLDKFFRCHPCGNEGKNRERGVHVRSG